VPSWREEGHLYFSCLITEEAVSGPRGLAHLYTSWRPSLEIRLQCNGDWGESTETKFGNRNGNCDCFEFFLPRRRQN